MRWVQSETSLLQSFVEFSLAWLEERNYTLTIDVDMEAWLKTLTHAPSTDGINPTFDPNLNPLSPSNSFWLDVRAGSHTIATSAARLFVTEDYMALKRSTKLWYDTPHRNEAPLAITVPSDMPKICGRVGHEGGLWIRPDHRKRGLSVILPHLNRALCLREWDIDWQTGLALRDIGECGIATSAYGFPHVTLCYEGKAPFKSRLERLFVTYMSRQELLAGIDLEAVAGLLPNRHQQTGDTAAHVQKR
jgi:hypothetical protein